MVTTQQEIREWLEEGRKKKDITHMIVVCDRFDLEDYPIYVAKTQNVRELYGEYHGPNMQKVMEVYSYKHDLEMQLQQPRAFYFD